jgi:hypothetical protein
MAGLVLEHLKLFTVYMTSFGSKGALNYVFWEQGGRPLERDHEREFERLCGYDVSVFSYLAIQLEWVSINATAEVVLLILFQSNTPPIRLLHILLLHRSSFWNSVGICTSGSGTLLVEGVVCHSSDSPAFALDIRCVLVCLLEQFNVLRNLHRRLFIRRVCESESCSISLQGR